VGHLRRHGRGPAARRPAVWQVPGALRPGPLPGRERLAAQGHRPGALRHAALVAARLAWMQLPAAAGNLLAERPTRRGPRRGEALL
jgi:hypothetical protein